MSDRLCKIIAWSLSFTVCILAVIAWGSTYHWHLLPLSTYLVFPLLGLLAFSIMWSHYIAGALRKLYDLPQGVLSGYFEATSLAVLVLICLHPGLLIYQRFRDGYGLPPGSYESYVAPGLGWITLLGTASLLVFLAYEFRRLYGRRPWWHYVQRASDVAMLAVFYHGWRLGGQLQMGWFRYAWVVYGVSLVLVLTYDYIQAYKEPASKTDSL